MRSASAIAPSASHRDVEELMVDRDAEVDHVTGFRWVQRFGPLLGDARFLPSLAGLRPAAR